VFGGVSMTLKSRPVPYGRVAFCGNAAKVVKKQSNPNNLWQNSVISSFSLFFARFIDVSIAN
jgi:hypothetical protein